MIAERISVNGQEPEMNTDRMKVIPLRYEVASDGIAKK